MPNWVFNRLTVTADEATLTSLAESVAGVSGSTLPGVEPEPLSFQSVLPRPAASDDDWYEWNVSNWGTKWDVNDVGVERSPGELVFVFDTAWSPPFPVVARLSQLFPAAAVRLDYREEQGWGGSLELAAGEVVAQDAYDVPQSHAEVVERGEECGCDEWFQPFDDCWVELAASRGMAGRQELAVIRALAPRWQGSLSQLMGAAPRL
jgi:hypothetical protein